MAFCALTTYSYSIDRKFLKLSDTESLWFWPFLLTCFGIIFVTFLCFRKGTPVGTDTETENVPECTGFPGTFSRNYTEVRNCYRNAWP